MDILGSILKAAPEIALFAALALGQALGRVKLGSFSLGGVAGSLIVALLIGQLDVALPDSLKAVCFALFIYSVGFKSGPEFFGGLERIRPARPAYQRRIAGGQLSRKRSSPSCANSM